MNILKKITQASKRAKLFIATATALVVVAGSAAVFAGFGPERPTFDWNNNPGTCDLQANRGDRCGSITPVFNSFINTPSYGDERNFTRIAEVVAGQSPTEADFSETKTATAGKEYWVRTLVHNDSNQNLNCSEEHRDPATNNCTQFDAGSPGIATGTKVSLEIASGTANGVDVMTKVSANNATPTTVWDTATLANGTQAFSVSYVNGSAVLYNGVHQGGVALSDSIVNGGTAVGYNQMDGNFPGCFDYAAYVYVKVKVSAPALKFDKLVRFAGEDSSKWRQELSAKKGDKVQYLLDFLNNGTSQVNNVVVRDQLPSNVTLVPGSVKWIDSNHPAPGFSIPDSHLFRSEGANLGNYGVNGGGYVMFDATVNSNGLAECSARNVGFVRGENVPEQNNDAVVVIENCQATVPTYSCDLLTLTKIGDRKYSYKVNYTATGGATLKSFTYNFGDGSQALTTDKNPVEYTYAKEGTYVPKVTVNFSVNGVDKSATNDNCAKPITMATTPTTLPNTGPGNIFGIFSGVSIVGALLHRRFFA